MLRMGVLPVHSHVRYPYPKTIPCAISSDCQCSSGWNTVRLVASAQSACARHHARSMAGNLHCQAVDPVSRGMTKGDRFVPCSRSPLTTMEGGPTRDPPTSQANKVAVPVLNLPNQEGDVIPKGPIQGPASVPRGLAGINARTREMATAKLPPSLRAKLEEVCTRSANHRMRGGRRMPCPVRRA